jgi:hypothetical protein
MGKTIKNHSLISIFLILAGLSTASFSDDAGDIRVKCLMDEVIAGDIFEVKNNGVPLSKLMEQIKNKFGKDSYLSNKEYIPKFVYQRNDLSKQEVQDSVYQTCVDNKGVYE